MFKITILDKSKKILRTYPHITKIIYNNYAEDIVLEGDEILYHQFPLTGYHHFYSETGNYTVAPDIIGTFEIEKKS